MIKKISKKISKVVKTNNERDARKNLIEELFYDFSRSKAQVYWMNFFRGIFFGFGTVLGGTVVVAIVIWILSQFTLIFPSIGNYLQQIIDAIQSSK